MHELTNRELYQAIAFAKSLDEEHGKQIMGQFQLDQPGLYQTIFGIFPAIIAEQNQEMACLFMDLCFDVICVFQHAFSDPPHYGMDPVWLEKQEALLDAELQSLIHGNTMDEKIRKSLQDRFTQRGAYDVFQPGLIKFLNEAIDEHASLNTSRIPAIKITQAMMYAVVRLFCNLYNSSTKQ
jgi:hypothetical protein